MDDSAPSFRIGHVVSQTFSIWLNHFVAIAALTAVGLAPNIIYWVLNAETATRNAAAGQVNWVSSLLATVGWFVGGLMIMHLVIAVRQGREPSARRSLAAGMRRLFPALVSLFVLTVLLIVTSFILGLLSIPLTLIHPAVASVVLFPLFLWVFMHFFVLPPVLVVEDVGPVAALGRSIDLMHGAKFKCLALSMVLFAAILGVNMLVALALVGAEPWLSVVVQSLLSVCLAGLLPVACGVSYAEVRERKEGVTVDELAQVFD